MAPDQTPPTPSQAIEAESRRDWLRMAVPLVLLVAAAFAVAWYFVKPAPPTHVVIAAGPKSGVYYAMAQRYVEHFKANGVTLEVRETRGSGDNFDLLNDPKSGVDVAIVQAGSSPPLDKRPHVQAVAGIYYEPVLVFYRGDESISRLPQLVGKRVAVGTAGSGVRVMAQLLLDEANVPPAAADGSPARVELGGDAAADALATGRVDAAFYVIAPGAPVVARLLSTPGVRLMGFDHARAYGRRHPFLSPTTLYRGSVDPARDLPAADVELVAATTTLVARDSTHQAIVQLLVRAAQEHNRGATLLSDAGAFPNALGSELPVNDDARYFLANPPGFLHRTLPFWLASLVDRLIILVVPLLVVLIPLVRMAPPLFRWRTDRKLLARYKRVRQIELRLNAESPPGDLRAAIEELRAMDRELATLKIPISFAQNLFDLRANVNYVVARLEGWVNPTAAAAVDRETPPDRDARQFANA